MTPFTNCHTLRRVLARRCRPNLCTGAMVAAGKEWTIRACDMPLIADAERASGVCGPCAAGWSHLENLPLVPPFSAAAHARFSLQHWQLMHGLAATDEERRRADEGIAAWSGRVSMLASVAAPIASSPGHSPAA